MTEYIYTYEDVIIDPSKEGIESLIGKEVYFHNNPSLCLENANEGSTDNLGILVEIFKNSIVPFRIEQKYDTCAHTCAHACIIEKKEEPKPKYALFKNAEEFLDAYYRNETKKLDGIYHYLATRGIWIKGKGTCTSYYMVTEVWDDGVIIGDSKINTTQVSSDRYFTANDTTEWEELFKNYTFLDGTPCGKEVRKK